MARSPSRSKMLNKTKAIAGACQSAFNSMYLSYSSTHKGVAVHGVHDITRLNIKKSIVNVRNGSMSTSDRKIGAEALMGDLEKNKYPWQYWICVYVDTGVNEVTSQIESGTVENTLLEDVSGMMPDLLTQLMDEDVIDRRKVLGWSWIASPSNYNDFPSSDDILHELFVKYFDVLNQKERHPLREIDVTKYLNVKRLMQA